MSYYDEETAIKKHFTEFYGGMQTDEEPNRIGDVFSPELLNVRPIGKGAYGPRNGIRRVGDKNENAGSCLNVYNFQKRTEEILIGMRGTSLVFLDGDLDGGTWTTIPGTSAYTEGIRFGFVNDDKYMYFGNGVANFSVWDGKNKSAQTITVDAGTNVITAAGHGMESGDLVVFTTTTTLPAGITAGTVYFVIEPTTDTFKISATAGGAEIDITDTGTGTHSVASSIKEYASNPKGNIYEIYLGRIFIAGVSATPTTVFYSVIGNGVDFSGSGSGNQNVDEGGDVITSLRVNTTPSGEKGLFVCKKSRRIHSITFDADGNISIGEIRRDTGCRTHASTIIVENDILYVDPGDNVANLGFRENIQNEIRSDPTTRTVKRTSVLYDFDSACAVYSKKYEMVLYCVKGFGGSYNDTTLAYFTEYGSWWLWSGINANEFAIYQNEIVWASSADQNFYTYDTSVFDDDVDEIGEEGAGTILSYRHTRDEEFATSRGGSVTLYSDRYKQTRFVKIRGFISTGATMVVKKRYDGNEDTEVVQQFTGADDGITSGNVSVAFGTSVFGRSVFGGNITSDSDFPMREFFVTISLDGYSNLRSRAIIEVQGAGTPYLINMISFWSVLAEEEHEPEESNRI